MLTRPACPLPCPPSPPRRAQQHLQAYQQGTEALVQQVEETASKGGWYLANELKSIVQSHREAQRQLAAQMSPAAAAVAAEQQQPAGQGQEQGQGPGQGPAKEKGKFMV